MPVPVPRINRPTAYPVVKHNPAQTKAIHIVSAIPNRLQSLPSWKRKSRHPGRQETLLPPPTQYSVQDFYKGLTAADNASVIKGAHAEACIPPKYNSIFLSQMISDTLPDDQSNCEVDGDYTMSSHRLSLVDQTQFHDSSSWDSNHLINHQGCGLLQEERSRYLNNPSFLKVATDAVVVNDRLSHQAISPNSDSPSGHDSGSSPMEPVTPFGEYIDRAVAAAQYPISDDGYADANAIHECYQDTQAVLNASQAPPVFPSIAEPPPKHQPVADTATPSTTLGFKKLSGPLADWVANYVWKVCTTGLSLPSAFSQSSVNPGHYAATPPSYLAASIHSLLLSTFLQPSAVLLALWYIVRLPVHFNALPLGEEFMKEKAFRVALLGDTDIGSDRETLETNTPFRLVVLGCVLANKWLDDHTFSNKTWHSISNVPIHTLNKLESLTLDIFSYDLSISSQQWSQWLAHVISYHLSLSSPIHPQPISRPSSNPHSIVRRTIEDIMKAPAAYNCTSTVPQPVFIGLEERLKEKIDKTECEIEALEIDLDEDGPLRQEYLPKRHVSNPGSQSRDNAAVTQEHISNQKWNVCEIPQLKQLPPPAKWSPAGDEPIFRDRNRVSGHYVAVQAPTATYAAAPCRPRDVGYNQTWNVPIGYTPVKSQPGYMYDFPPMIPFNQSNYNPFGHIPSLAISHARTQSFSYDQDSFISRNRMRSYSQSRFDYQGSELRMTISEHGLADEAGSRWMETAHHYPYSGPAFIPVPIVGMQPAW
ncbi:hypothetical protein BYT27DRAFT_6720568 [Phlegmacium glaucopus]|nr:hypothetical protein BYT27DRAFT_6720568 [Phlegmacium glaucopus]